MAGIMGSANTPTELSAPNATQPRRATLVYAPLVAAAVVVVVLRWHTIDEPLDCDEAAYGYVAHRVLAGDRLYADVFENKPPLAYAPYAAAIAIGGYSERSIRILPIPFVLATLWCVWQFTREHAGRWGAAAAAGIFAVASTDPIVFGNGANLELYMNPLLVLSLWTAVRAGRGGHWIWTVASGLAVGAATAIKQVAGLFAIFYAVWYWLELRRARARAWGVWLTRMAWFGVGAVVPWAGCVLFVVLQGVFSEFVDAVIVYGPTLAREAANQLAERRGPGAVSSLARDWPVFAAALRDVPGALSLYWLARGNPDATVWWGAGVWPLLVLGFIGGGTSLIGRRRVASVTLAFCAVVVLAINWPGLYWQHYYMLLVPGSSILAGCTFELVADRARALRGARSLRGVMAVAAGSLGIVGLTALLGVIQWRGYLNLSPAEITTHHKGGQQWCALRDLARSMRPGIQAADSLFNWGWQSPLHVYTQMDSVTPYFFTDPLLQTYDVRPHPLVTPRKERILSDLARSAPTFVFIGQRLFPELQQVLSQRYTPLASAESVRLSEGRGLYIRNDAAFRLRQSPAPR